MFTGCFTGCIQEWMSVKKKALPATELHKLLYGDPKSDILRRTQAIAALMFQFCGMSFADLAHLEKSSLDRNVLHYNRVKTKTPMSVEILDTAKDMIYQLQNRKPALQDCPDYLFSILNGNKNGKMKVLIGNTSLPSGISITI